MEKIRYINTTSSIKTLIDYCKKQGNILKYLAENAENEFKQLKNEGNFKI